MKPSTIPYAIMTDPNSQKENRFKLIAILTLVIVSGAVFANSLKNDFVCWDDASLIKNRAEHHSLGLKNLKLIFDFGEGVTFQPIRSLSYALDYQFWQLHPWGYHLHNIALHTLAAIFLFLSLLLALPQIHDTGLRKINKPWLAFTTALLFTLHPINVESVTWLSSRKYNLVAFFGFLSFYLFIKSSAKKKYYLMMMAGSIISCLLSVMSSPFGCVFPGLFFLFDFCRVRTLNPFSVVKKQLLFYAPYILAFCFIIYPIVGNLFSFGGPMKGAQQEHYLGNPYYTFFSVLRALFDYIRNLILPFWLNCRYPDYISTTFFSVKTFVAATVIVLILLSILIKCYKGNKLLLFCAGWFFIAWFPVSNIIPISTLMADRYIYTAAPGFFLWAVFCIMRGIHWMTASRYKRYQKPLSIVCLCALILYFAPLTIQRNTVWFNCETLWRDSLAKDTRNFVAHFNLALYLKDQGQEEESQYHLLETVKYNPDFKDAHFALGNSFAKQKEYAKALFHYREVIRIKPSDVPAYLNIGATLDAQGDFDAAMKQYLDTIKRFPHNSEALLNTGHFFLTHDRLTKALFYFEKALALRPQSPTIHNDVAIVYEKMNQLDQAIAHYEKALRLNADLYQIHFNLGDLYLKRQILDKAQSQFKRSIEIKPDYLEAHEKLASLYGLQGHIADAIHQYQEAIKIDPNAFNAYFNLGNLYLNQGKPEQAIPNYLKAIDIAPLKAQLHNNLGIAYMMSKNPKAALAHFEKALSVDPDFSSARTNLNLAKQQVSSEPF